MMSWRRREVRATGLVRPTAMGRGHRSHRQVTSSKAIRVTGSPSARKLAAHQLAGVPFAESILGAATATPLAGSGGGSRRRARRGARLVTRCRRCGGSQRRARVVLRGHTRGMVRRLRLVRSSRVEEGTLILHKASGFATRRRRWISAHWFALQALQAGGAAGVATKGARRAAEPASPPQRGS